MAISSKQISLGDYAKQAAAYAQQAASSSWSPEVGYTSNAYVNSATGQPYSVQDLINMGGGDPNKMMQVPVGQDFMSQWGWTLPILGAAAAAGGAALAGGTAAGGAGAGGTEAAALTGSGVGALAGGSALPGGITVGQGALAGGGLLASAGAPVTDASAATVGSDMAANYADANALVGANTASEAAGLDTSGLAGVGGAGSLASGMGSAADAAAAGTLPGIGALNGYSNVAGLGGLIGNGYTGSLSTTGLGGLVNNAIGNGGSMANGSYQFPWSQAIGAALGAFDSNQAASQYNSMIDKVINADQWRTQQPNYFQPLQDAATKGIGNTPYGQSILNSVMRSSAAKGYNMSGNFITDAGNALNQGTTDYIKALTPLGMGNSPYGAQTTAANLGSQSIAQNQNTYGNLGYGLGSILSGQQPTGLQTLFGGTPQNNNLIQSISGLA